MRPLYSTPCLHRWLPQTTRPAPELQWLDFGPGAGFRASLLELMRWARQYLPVVTTLAGE